MGARSDSRRQARRPVSRIESSSNRREWRQALIRSAGNDDGEPTDVVPKGRDAGKANPLRMHTLVEDIVDTARDEPQLRGRQRLLGMRFVSEAPFWRQALRSLHELARLAQVGARYI